MRRFSWMVAALGLTACGGAEVTGIVENEVTLTLAAFSSDADAVAPGEPQAGIGVSRAVLRASSLSLGPCLTGAADVTLGARAYDLLAATPPSETVTTAVTTLCRVRVDLDPLAGTQLDDVPEDATLFASGVDAAGEAFELSSPRSFSLSFEAEPGSGFGDQPLLLGFDLATWLAGLPTPDTEGDREAFEAQLEAAAALYGDADGDGNLDDDEKTPLLSARVR